MKNLTEALTFDDVLIVPSKSELNPNDVDCSTNVTKNIKLKFLLFLLQWIQLRNQL